jgi:hypothetical protein
VKAKRVRWGEQILADMRERARRAGAPPPVLVPVPAIERPKMNRTEQRMAQRLEVAVKLGLVVRFGFELVTLRLADRVRYTPDFFVVYPDGLGFVEVKGGFIRDDARIKLQVAARMYPELRFTLAQYVKGAWTESAVAR